MAANQQTAFELTEGATKVGVLVPENERALRFVVIDARYRLLDGSRFPSVRQAEMTVQRLSNFVDHPPTANAAWVQPTTGSLIAAWDVSVFASATATTPLSGRVWADYLPLNSGANDSSYVYLDVYVLNNEGYLYRQQQVVDPFGYIFFANNRGFLNSSTGSGVYKSVASAGGVLATGYSFHRPDQADTSSNFTHKTFFQTPSTDLPASASYWSGGSDWLRVALPVLPPQIEDVSFVGVDGTDGQAAGVAGGGGTFHFTNPASDTLAVRITIPLSDNGVNTDRVLNGTAPPGSGTLVWDGLDGSGNPVVSNGTLTYDVVATLLAGEIHFPFFDVERSQSLIVNRLNGPASSALWPTDMLYWDHVLVPGTGQPVPLTNLEGLRSSSQPAMSYGSNWGNDKGLDAWTYVPADQQGITSAVTVRGADLRIIKTADFQPFGRGGPVAYTLTIDNLSADTYARAARVQDSFASTLTGMSWTCEIVVPGSVPADVASSCDSASGSGNLSALVSLRAGARAVFRIRGTLSASAGSTQSNTATITRSADAGDPVMANNSSTVDVSTAPGYSLSGHVFEDLQGNGVLDSGEAWAGGVPLWVSLVKTSGEVIDSRQILAGDGAWNMAGIPAGSYRLLLTNQSLGDTVVAPDGFQFLSPTTGQRQITLSASTAGLDFALLRGSNRVAGRVFVDDGAGGGIAYNGIVDGSESGLAAVSVQLLDVATAAVVRSGMTGADGSYSLALPTGGGSFDLLVQTPAGYLSISESVGNLASVVNASQQDDRLRLTTSGGNHQGVNFGDVRQPALQPDQTRSARPGSSLFLPHVFSAPGSGQVSFSLQNVLPNPAMAGWDTRFLADSNCNGTLDSGEAVLSSAVSVVAGQQYCLLLQVTVPSGAPINAQWRASVQAQMSYLDSGGGLLLQAVRSAQDLVTSGDNESLVLLKAVDRNTASAGDVLTYTLTWRNDGSGAIVDLQIRDTTPAYTQYVGGSAACVLPLPTGITSCAAAEAPANGAGGPVRWTLGGSLPPGASGQVRYQVRVEGM